MAIRCCTPAATFLRWLRWKCQIQWKFPRRKISKWVIYCATYQTEMWDFEGEIFQILFVWSILLDDLGFWVLYHHWNLSLLELGDSGGIDFTAEVSEKTNRVVIFAINQTEIWKVGEDIFHFFFFMTINTFWWSCWVTHGRWMLFPGCNFSWVEMEIRWKSPRRKIS